MESLKINNFGVSNYDCVLNDSLESDENDLSKELDISQELVSDRLRTITVLKQLGLPVPQNQVIYFLADLVTAIDRVGGYPVAIKPDEAFDKGGNTLNICTLDKAKAACSLALAKSRSGGVVVEKYYPGYNYRILVVNGRAIRAIETDSVDVEDNLQDSPKQLASNNSHLLQATDQDRQSDRSICNQPSKANEPVGGFVEANRIVRNFTHKIHWQNIYLAQIIAAIVGLQVIEVEMVSNDLSLPMSLTESAVIGVNNSILFKDYFA